MTVADRMEGETSSFEEKLRVSDPAMQQPQVLCLLQHQLAEGSSRGA